MDLVHWNLLYLLPLAAIPIVLHLLTLHRLRTVELSTFRFLFDSYVQQRRRMKFLEALLAMLRTLFLLLLVVACTRPVVRHWGALFGGGSGREVIMLVDCSASMNARTDGVSALERAKAAARSVLERLASDDRVTLVRVASKPEEVFSRFTSDAEAIESHLEDLQASPSRGNWFAALSQVFGPGAPERSTPSVYVFTDCQASNWRELEAQGIGRLVPEETQVLVVNVGSTDPQANLAVVGDAPRESRGIVGLPIVLRPRITNHSKTETSSVAVSVFVDEREVARYSQTVKPGDTVARDVIFVPSEPGTLRGRFEIGEDRFPDDDQFLFTLSVVPQVKVLLVNGNPSADPYEDEVLYLRTALTSVLEDERTGEEKVEAAPDNGSPASPGDPPPDTQSPNKQLVRALDVREIVEGNLNAEALVDISVVVLANCGGLNDQHFAWLRDFVSAGGGLLILPGDKVNPDVYNGQFFPVPGPQQERLLWVTLGPAVGDAQNLESFVRLGAIDYAHPVLNVFDDPQARYLTTANFYRRFPLTLDEARTNCWPLARFTSQEPAVVEGRFHDGVVLLAAFPVTARWTNLPLKPEFVPLILRMVHHLEHRPDFESPSVVPADGAAEIAVAAAWAPAVGQVTDEMRRSADIDFKRAGSRLVGAFEGTQLKGYYSVEVRGGRVELPKSGAAAFAVNLAPEESQFVAATEEQFRQWLPDTRLTLVDASAEAQQQLGAIGDGREIWRIPLLLTFLIIGVEFMLATLGGTKPETGDDESVGERLRRYSPGTWVGRMTGAAEPVETT